MVCICVFRTLIECFELILIPIFIQLDVVCICVFRTLLEGFELILIAIFT